MAVRSLHQDPWDDWDSYAATARVRESAPIDGPRVRSRVVRGFIWFALAIMPARERWIGWLLDRPHAIVQAHDGPIAEVPEFLPSLPSSS